MREIKFRVWANGEMTKPFGLGQNKYDVNPAMWDDVMQFTGLKDKNGKEIYEGDILKGDWAITDDIEVGAVEFYGGAFRFKPAGLPIEFGYYRKECEVIGNIYENPDLIDKSK